MRFLLPGAIVLIAACQPSEEPGEAHVQEPIQVAEALGQQLSPEDDAEAVIVKLAFPKDIDLDLYVTGPLLETVYFANHRSASGGEISDDIRCDSTDDRIETVIYRKPMAGRYRVGIDFPGRCEGEPGPGAYSVFVQHPGGELRKSGAVELERFEVAVLEFEI